MSAPKGPAQALVSDDHQYNDDFLFLPEEQQQARSDFPTIFHVLDDPDLRLIVKPIDDRANTAKRRAQISGMAAVILAVLALVCAASAPLWEHLVSPIPVVLAAGSAFLGVLAAIISLAGLLYGQRKLNWLHDRFRTERFRQYRFQALIWRLKEIAESFDPTDPAKAEATFRQRRKVWLDGLNQDLTNRVDSKVTAVLEPSAREETWLHDTTGGKPKIPTGFAMDAIFRAYRKLRFQAQLDYANHKLRKESWSWRFGKLALRQQAKFLLALWVVSFGALVAVHVVIIVAHLAQLEFASNAWFHVAVVWLALFAIGVRTVEHGLALPREIERYEDYRASIRELLLRFDGGNDRDKIETMVEMERLGFDELRSFLRTHSEATFVL